MTDTSRLATQALAPTTPKATPKPAKEAGVDLSLDFDDIVDALNPLQHLPGVSAVYRQATGDHIGLAARLAGDFLYGGPIGLAGGAAMAMFEAITGDSPVGHIAALVEEEDAVASAATPAAQPHPWMKAPGDASPTPALPSKAALAAALAQGTPAVSADAAPAAPAKEQPAPQLLAKLYEMQATQPAGTRSIHL
ncbi:hypothetical protein [Azospirillum rugosum]|uniref:Uncharacterized protein n=1 Tax=Azospirillum rugosum TaxID=416170 RepID=A0ABS4SXD2_9PROT|nr:hypothetical protein [Azospirillum rugosum]MBP2297206.1 hypothetical protein [Azospirillum rugosum]MDQ0531028.1 hypothetical protein [Azospirillum rugosum]